MTGLRILVAEDDVLIAICLEEVLADMGHRVCATTLTQSETVSAALRCRPDLMIVDATLDDGSGIEAVAEILRAGYIPHLFATGDAQLARTLAPQSVVIRKPYVEHQLAEAIDRAMALRPALAHALAG